MAELINGKDILVLIMDETDSAPVAIYCSTSCTLNISADTVPVSCKDSGSWNNTVEGTKSWDVSVDALYQVETEKGFVDISDLLLDDTLENKVKLAIGEYKEAGDIYWEGDAVLTSASLTANDGEIATWTCTFNGDGPLAKKVYPPA